MIIVLEKDPAALRELVESIRKLSEGEMTEGFDASAGALALAQTHAVNTAFIDADGGDWNAPVFARRLLDLNPRTNIIFISADTACSAEAMAMHASGLIAKPVTQEKLRRELGSLRYPLPGGCVFRKAFFIRTFSNFEVYAHGVPMRFHYSKTKELFAYLVDRRGALCTNSEITAALWEDDDEDAHVSYLKNLKHDLRTSLKLLGIEELLVCTRGRTGVLVRPGICDYFDHLAGIPDAQPYRGEYMSQYSWAEMTHAALEMERLKKS